MFYISVRLSFISRNLRLFESACVQHIGTPRWVQVLHFLFATAKKLRIKLVFGA